MIALTFDDGPGPSTPAILDALRTHGVRATFFVIGAHIAGPPWAPARDAGRAIVRQALCDGHLIGNHTFSHAREPQPEIGLRREVEATDALIREVAAEFGFAVGVPPFRLPFGVLPGETRLLHIGALGRPHVHWSKDFDDWHPGPIDRLWPAILAYVDERERAGLDSVLDLHDGGIGGPGGYDRSATADAVRRLLDEAARRDWRFFQVPAGAIAPSRSA